LEGPLAGDARAMCSHTGARGGACRSWALPGEIHCAKHRGLVGDTVAGLVAETVAESVAGLVAETVAESVAGPIAEPVAVAHDSGKGTDKGKGKSKGKSKSKDPWDDYDFGNIHETPGISNVRVEWEHIDVKDVLNACGLTATRQEWCKWGSRLTTAMSL
jgi:hypothetical protein